MSISYVSDTTKFILWGKAAGRCEYCNRPIYFDNLTKCEFNTAYIAHIIASRVDGPRGHPTESERLRGDISNLMLLCDTHHRLIDKDDVEGHPVDLLRDMKKKHEERVFLQTNVSNKQSHVILYGEKVGYNNSNLTWENAFEAMTPEKYPAEKQPIILGIRNSALCDDDPEYWEKERRNLNLNFDRLVRRQVEDGHIDHVSVFAIAPQPLLIELGRLISDIRPAEVYQLQREPTTWRWQNHPEVSFRLIPPVKDHDVVALNISLSATVSDDRIFNVLGPKLSIWTLTIDSPHNDFLKTKESLCGFRKCMRTAFDKIKAKHGHNTVLHVFPAMPVSAAVEFGRVWQPKADMEMVIYDENRKIGGFVEAFTLRGHDFLRKE